MKKIEYKIDIQTDFRCADLYAYVMRRGLELVSKDAYYGMIVMHSMLFSSGFRSLREALFKNTSQSWFSAFSRIPAGLFSGDVRVRNAIVISKISIQDSVASFYTTRMHRWYGEQRNELMSLVQYTKFSSRSNIPCNSIQALVDLYERQASKTVNTYSSRNGAHSIFFKQSAYNWISASLQPAPVYASNGDLIPPSMIGKLSFKNQALQKYILLLLNGKLTFSYWATFGDDFHVTRDDIVQIPFPEKISQTDLSKLDALASLFISKLESCVQYKLNAGKRVGTYNTSKLWSITDESDKIFLKYFTDTPEQVFLDIQTHIQQVVLTGQSEIDESDDADE